MQTIIQRMDKQQGNYFLYLIINHMEKNNVCVCMCVYIYISVSAQFSHSVVLALCDPMD